MRLMVPSLGTDPGEMGGREPVDIGHEGRRGDCLVAEPAVHALTRCRSAGACLVRAGGTGQRLPAADR